MTEPTPQVYVLTPELLIETSKKTNWSLPALIETYEQARIMGEVMFVRLIPNDYGPTRIRWPYVMTYQTIPIELLQHVGDYIMTDEEAWKDV